MGDPVREAGRWGRRTLFPRHAVAGWASLIDVAARLGDGVAGNLLGSAAQALATLAAAVRGQLFPPSEAVDVHYSGGVFRSDPLLERFRTLVELQELAHVSPPLHDPAQGALLEAYRIAGLRIQLR